MFNFQGSELIIILLLALVVLGPEKLPDAMRRLGRFYADLKKMSTGFQDEFRAAVDEPTRELRDTAKTLKDSVDFTKFADGERPEKPKSAEMASPGLAAADPDAAVSDDIPFGNGDRDAATPDAATPDAATPDLGGPSSVPAPPLPFSSSTPPSSDSGSDTDGSDADGSDPVDAAVSEPATDDGLRESRPIGRDIP